MHMQEDCPILEREEEFSKAVESIMRCEDFKSNFARKLSNRYISRSPTNPKQDSSLKLRPQEPRNVNTIPDKVPERIEHSSQHSQKMELNEGTATALTGKPMGIKPSTLHSQVTALQMEVDTLAWQLSQTEASRQMHIALLDQIVTFLHKVKGHIECQKKSDEGSMKDIATSHKSDREMPRSFNSVDLPRSRSVVHVNKHLEYTLGPKKIGTRKISKSISNVNGFRDSIDIWNQSKLSLSSEPDTYKISEEISRLISLAKTVMSIKLPDLTNGCNDLQHVSSTSKNSPKNGKKQFQSESSLTEYDGSPASLTCDLVNDLVEIKLTDKKQQSPICENKSNGTISKPLSSNRRLDYNHTTSTFIEDESGFSSMSSFQEIGIPIINIIPPSPNKEVGYNDNIPELVEETGTWNNEILLNKQNVKVFWV